MKTLELKVVKRRYRGPSLMDRGSFPDFVVSGRPIQDRLRSLGIDRIPVIDGAPLPPLDLETRERLLLETEGDTPNGRVALYFCPCGDYYCGVVSVKIIREDSDFIWHDFAFEPDWDDDMTLIEKLGPFRFDGEQYRKAVMATKLAG